MERKRLSIQKNKWHYKLLSMFFGNDRKYSMWVMPSNECKYLISLIIAIVLFPLWILVKPFGLMTHSVIGNVFISILAPFIIFGLLTVVIGMLSIFYLPFVENIWELPEGLDVLVGMGFVGYFIVGVCAITNWLDKRDLNVDEEDVEQFKIIKAIKNFKESHCRLIEYVEDNVDKRQ